MDAVTYVVGATVFFAHPEESWVVGKIEKISTNPKGQKLYECSATSSPNQPLVSGTIAASVNSDAIHPVVGDLRQLEAEDVDDLLELSYLHESTLLHQVRKRYFNNIIYTRIGPIVLALNPFDYTLPNYVESNMPKYLAEGDRVVHSRSQLLPHAWSTAHLAYWQMRTFHRNQSVIVSGESGAGKTETAKIVLRYLGRVSTQECSDRDREEAQAVTEKVNQTSPILEAFGNAKTVRNDNSSRFGKFMKVQFSSAGIMTGSAIEVYLLEKSRIVTHGLGERSYHSFYQLLRGSSGAVKAALCLDDPDRYKTLAVGQATLIEGVDDAADFRGVCSAMDVVGMPADEQLAVWNVVAGVLAGLRIEFGENADSEAFVLPASEANAAVAAQRWKVDAAPLLLELVQTQASAGADKFTRKLTASQANDTKEALCKSMYERLFLYLVERINALIDHHGPAAPQWIGLLDIFGFESFQVNSFEQLCINLANETLQNHYNNIIFTKDMEECRAEGINTESVVFYDNMPCLELLGGSGGSGKMSILALLDEECSLGKGTDAAFGEKVLQNFASHPNLVTSKTQRGVFGVQHYAGSVTYCVDGFRDKNSDALKDSLKRLLRTSEDPRIARLLPEPEDRRGKPLTVSGLFRQQLGTLMEAINSTTPHWVRCIKPHSAKKPRMFHGAEVMTQVRCAGVLETVRIRKMSYSMRFLFDDFWRMFRNLASRQLPAGGLREGALVIIRAVGLGPELAQVGHTKAFLKFDGYHEIVLALARVNAARALTIQRFAWRRRSSDRLHAARLNYKVKVITAMLRGRASDVAVKARELAARERMLRERFRTLLLLQAEEERVRMGLVAAASDARDAIGTARRADFERARDEWSRRMQQHLAAQQRVLLDAETAARQSLIDAQNEAREGQRELEQFAVGETSERAKVQREESIGRHHIMVLADASLTAVRAVESERALQEVRMRFAGLELSETRDRDAIEVEERHDVRLVASIIALQWDAFFVGIPTIHAQEHRQREVIMGIANESMQWNERKWWADKAAKDKRDVQALLTREQRDRVLLWKEEEYDIVKILGESERSYEIAYEALYARIQNEEFARREAMRQKELKRRREERERQEEQRRLDQLAHQNEIREQQRRREMLAQEEMARLREMQQRLGEADQFDVFRLEDASRWHRTAHLNSPDHATDLTPRRVPCCSGISPTSATLQITTPQLRRSPSMSPSVAEVMAYTSTPRRANSTARSPSATAAASPISPIASSADMLGKLRSLMRHSAGLRAAGPSTANDATSTAHRGGRRPLLAPPYHDA